MTTPQLTPHTWTRFPCNGCPYCPSQQLRYFWAYDLDDERGECVHPFTVIMYSHAERSEDVGR